MKPYYSDDFATIYHGDALEVLEVALGVQYEDSPTSRFDLAFADPPYNFGIPYDGYGDCRPAPDYRAWCVDWFCALQDAASKVIVTPGHGNLGMWLGIAKPSGVGAWYKPGGTGSSHLGWCEWEPWLYWGQRLGGSDVVKATLNPQFKSDVGHPCPKPVELVKQLIVKTKAESIVDPFLGSGTTLVAAKELGVTAVGIEQSERYCELAASRLTQEVLDFGAVS